MYYGIMREGAGVLKRQLSRIVESFTVNNFQILSLKSLHNKNS